MSNSLSKIQYCSKPTRDEIDMLILLLNYFYGDYTQKIVENLNLDDLSFCYSKKTKRLRAIMYRNEMFAFIRASDFRLIPHIPLAILLHKVIPFPKHRIVVINEIVPDIMGSHTIFSKHVIQGDENIKPFDEVLIVDEEDNLIGVGRAIISYEAMITSLRGPAVQVREKVER